MRQRLLPQRPQTMPAIYPPTKRQQRLQQIRQLTRQNMPILMRPNLPNTRRSTPQSHQRLQPHKTTNTKLPNRRTRMRITTLLTKHHILSSLQRKPELITLIRPIKHRLKLQPPTRHQKKLTRPRPLPLLTSRKKLTTHDQSLRFGTLKSK